MLGSFFYALTLKLPIQASLSVVPQLPVSLRSDGKCDKFSETSTSLFWSSGDVCPGFQSQGGSSHIPDLSTVQRIPHIDLWCDIR